MAQMNLFPTCMVGRKENLAVCMEFLGTLDHVVVGPRCPYNGNDSARSHSRSTDSAYAMRHK